MPNDKLTTGLNALRALESKATQGKLAVSRDGRTWIVSVDRPNSTPWVATFSWKQDADQYAALRNSAPQMLAVIEAAASFTGDGHRHDCAQAISLGVCWCYERQLEDLRAALSALAAVLPKGE